MESLYYVIGKTKDQKVKDCRITPHKLALTWVVEFQGEDLDLTIPERLGGGVQVRVLDPGQIYSAEQFAKIHHFQFPIEAQREEEKGMIDLEEPKGGY